MDVRSNSLDASNIQRRTISSVTPVNQNSTPHTKPPRAIQIRPDTLQNSSLSNNNYSSLAQANITRKIEIEKVIGSPDIKQRITSSSLASAEPVASKPINIASYRSGNINEIGHSNQFSSSMNNYPLPQRQEAEVKLESNRDKNISMVQP